MKIKEKLKVALVGCGLIGQRRAKCIYRHAKTKLAVVADIDPRKTLALSKKYHCQRETDWKKVVQRSDIDIVVVSTPNHLLCPVACTALESGKELLIEKPMGRNLREAGQIFRKAVASRKKLKIGFNHRYHPAIQEAYRLFKKGVIGRPLNIRAIYGHGGRPGYEKEWRGNYKLAGGGELTDQGVHLIDLIQWFCGQPAEVFSILQTEFWRIQPAEDNAFVLLRYANGVVASFHVSWTQWKNQFSFEIYGAKGSLCIQGLGGSYGRETLILTLRNPKGGIPKQIQEKFPEKDFSWQLEWNDFVEGLLHRKKFLGDGKEGFRVMQTLDAIYRSSKEKKPICL